MVIPRKHYLFITLACIGVWVTVAYMRNIRGLFLNLVCRHAGLTDKEPKWLGSFLSPSLQYDWYSVWCASLTLIHVVMPEFKLCCWLGRQCTKSYTVHPLDSEIKMHPSNRALKVWFAILCSLVFFIFFFIYLFFALKCNKLLKSTKVISPLLDRREKKIKASKNNMLLFLMPRAACTMTHFSQQAHKAHKK